MLHLRAEIRQSCGKRQSSKCLERCLKSTHTLDIGGYARPFLSHRSDDFAFQGPHNGTKFGPRPIAPHEGGAV